LVLTHRESGLDPYGLRNGGFDRWTAYVVQGPQACAHRRAVGAMAGNDHALRNAARWPGRRRARHWRRYSATGYPGADLPAGHFARHGLRSLVGETAGQRALPSVLWRATG